MGAMKRLAEDVSVDMGLGGEISEEVLEEAQRRLQAGKELAEKALSRFAGKHKDED